MPRILFIAPVFRQYPVLITALREQRNPEWQLMLIHNGADDSDVALIVDRFADSRILYSASASWGGDWGHGLRDWALREVELRPIDCEFIVVTNADNYYVPGFIDLMLDAFRAESGLVGVYCQMLHNYWDWRVIDSELQCGRIDCGCVMVTREAAISVGWPSRHAEADWDYINGIVRRYGHERLKKVHRILFVHN